MINDWNKDTKTRMQVLMPIEKDFTREAMTMEFKVPKAMWFLTIPFDSLKW